MSNGQHSVPGPHPAFRGGIAAALALLLLGATLQAEPRAGTAPLSSRQAMIVVALAATEGYEENCLQWADQLARRLTNHWGLEPSRLTLAGPEKSFLGLEGAQRVAPTRAGLEAAIRTINSALDPESEFFLFVFGSGSWDGHQYKLNLRGPDLSGQEIRELLAPLRARRQAIFWGTSSSGALVPMLSAAGRVLIAATRSGMERNDPRFPGFFVESLGDSATDTDKDQRVSWLEAFLAARRKTEQSYKDGGHLATEHALLEDSGDGVGQAAPSEENGQGLLAAATFFSPPRMPTGPRASDPRLRTLYQEREALESAIQALRGRRKDLTTADYDRRMEDLLIRLARTAAEIRKLEGEPEKPR